MSKHLDGLNNNDLKVQKSLNKGWLKSNLYDFLAVFKSKLVARSHMLESSSDAAYQLDDNREYHFYTRFTDRVDPSLYYTIFCSHKDTE